jgi:hypothetical protein
LQAVFAAPVSQDVGHDGVVSAIRTHDVEFFDHDALLVCVPWHVVL